MFGAANQILAYAVPTWSQLTQRAALPKSGAASPQPGRAVVTGQADLDYHRLAPRTAAESA